MNGKFAGESDAMPARTIPGRLTDKTMTGGYAYPPVQFNEGVGKLMTNKQGSTGLTRGEWIAMTIFTVFFGLYVLNVLLGKATIVFGWKTYHLGNIGEFLILLAASAAFIVAALHQEAMRKLNQKPDKK